MGSPGARPVPHTCGSSSETGTRPSGSLAGSACGGKFPQHARAAPPRGAAGGLVAVPHAAPARARDTRATSRGFSKAATLELSLPEADSGAGPGIGRLRPPATRGRTGSPASGRQQPQSALLAQPGV